MARRKAQILLARAFKARGHLAARQSRQIFRSPGRAFAWVLPSFFALPRFALLERVEDNRSAPRRLERLSTPPSRSNRPEAGSAMDKSSACSRRGLVVDPGGAPAPPECSIANGTRGRRTPSRISRRLAKAPLKRTRCGECKGVLSSGDKFADTSSSPGLSRGSNRESAPADPPSWMPEQVRA
jgi:hypothetical protein